MSKDFDNKGTDREFTLSGQKFHWREIGWREQGNWFDVTMEKALAQQARNEELRKQAEAEGRELDPTELDRTPLVKTLEEVVAGILHYVEPDERPRLTEVIESTENPVTIQQLNDLGLWLQEVQADRPTQPPADSSPGDGSIAPTLQAV